MDPLTLGFLSAASGPILDLFTGASGKQKDAYDAQQKQLQAIMDRIKGDMGSSAADSTSYKTAMAEVNKGYKRQSDANQQNAAASGMSDEAQLGQMALTNDGYNSQQLGALSKADQDRRQLQSQYDQVAAQKAGLGVERANNAVQQQNALIGGAMQLVPYMIGGSTPASNPVAPVAPARAQLTPEAMAVKPVPNFNTVPSSSSPTNLARLLRMQNTFPSVNNYFGGN